MDYTTAIRQSLTAFVCGILGLLPLVGVVPSVCALFLAVKVSRRYHDWNPASVYLKWAGVLGVLGIVVSMLAAFYIGLAIISSGGTTQGNLIEFRE